MQCPIDGSPLTMSERSGVEIDYCPQCRGVWLDRGELDKIIERAGMPAAPSRPAPGFDNRGNQRGYGDRSYGQPYGKRKKENWLSELFD
ncbi:zf-TFIIB domain-containing protein [Diaminobutyricimonas sp. TR449]|uniref:TFIIB-type zinc ribbon-containing protein n=2 Tax=unclassified Diaminobutyricimonas TaxID=2643261 RepID=UPI001421E00F|nr:zf-TFIIB domain-containing protein [Diaminobutyricimonas sp. TR449]